MKFGKDFRTHLDETLPEWRDKFLCYKPLKKLIKSLSPESDEGADGRPLTGLEEWFVRILDEELEKFNDFYVDKEEDFVIRLQELKEIIDTLRVKQRGALTSESRFSEELFGIKKAFVTIHGEMVLLKNYSSLNFAGIVKIVKKYDKRTRGLLSLTFTRHALHQPFFTIEPLTRLVHECEANLELLFPIEAEVTDGGSDDKDARCDSKSTAGTETSSAHEDADDICRSTLAAMKAIQGLRRASSTCNPLSIGQFFHGQGDGSATVTWENSGSNGRSELDVKGADLDCVNSM